LVRGVSEFQPVRKTFDGTRRSPASLRLVSGKQSTANGHNGHTTGAGIPAKNSVLSAGNRGVLERLEAENTELRRKAADLALQIQSLRDLRAQLPK